VGSGHSGAGGDRLSDARRWRVLGLLALAEVLGMSLWFSASAVSGQYRAMWQLSASEAGWLTTMVQLGFVVGTASAAVLNLADLLVASKFRRRAPHAPGHPVPAPAPAD
jgi:hypothetical protein